MTIASKSMLITLTPEQTRYVTETAAALTRGEIEADCEPSGYYLMIAVGGGIPSTLEVKFGNAWKDLGDVDVEFVDEVFSEK